MNRDVTLDFLTNLYDGVEHGWLTVFAIDRAGGPSRTLWAPVDQPDQLLDQVDALAGAHCVWFGVATRQRRLGDAKRGGIDDCMQITALWCDLDYVGPAHARTDLLPNQAAAEAAIARFELPPTVVVHSGNGLQPWWLLDEPINIPTAVELLDRWEVTWDRLGGGHHVDHVYDVPRIMRLPGTTNNKPENCEPLPVRILEVDWTRRYGASDILELLDEVPQPEHRPITLRAVPNGGERPGDRWAAATDWADLLVPLGWHHKYTDRHGERYWVRPGNDPRGHIGATTGNTANDRLKVFTSSVPPLVEGETYSKFAFRALMEHHGDHAALAQQLVTEGWGSTPTPPASVDPITGEVTTLVDQAADELPEGHNPLAKYLIDWGTFWTTDHNATEWLCEPLFAASRAHALYAGAKTGKSFLVLAATAAMATGRPFLHKPHGEPLDVLYVDYEMTPDDLHDRLLEFGYGPDDDLSHLHYALLPSLPPLDTDPGGLALTMAAQACGARFVVIDTTGRSTQGDENEASTFQDFYRHTGLRLKQAGIGWVRLDHAGKDAEKGQRGSSAKNDDVDIVVKLTRTDTGVAVKATHRRVGWYPEATTIEIGEDGHGVTTFNAVRGEDHRPYAAGTVELVKHLDRLEVPVDLSRRAVRPILKNAGITATNTVLSDAIRFRRATRNDVQLAPRPVDNPSDHSTDHEVVHRPRTDDRTTEPTPENTGRTTVRTTSDHPPDGMPDHLVPLKEDQVGPVATDQPLPRQLTDHDF